MELITRISGVIVPVFLIVAIGYGYARRQRPDLSTFNRIALDVLAPVLVYSALAARDFEIQQHLPLLLGGTVLILGGGLLAWPLVKRAAIFERGNARYLMRFLFAWGATELPHKKQHQPLRASSTVDSKQKPRREASGEVLS